MPNRADGVRRNKHVRSTSLFTFHEGIAFLALQGFVSSPFCSPGVELRKAFSRSPVNARHWKGRRARSGAKRRAMPMDGTKPLGFEYPKYRWNTFLSYF